MGAYMALGTLLCEWHGQTNGAVLAESLLQHLRSQICPEPLCFLSCPANGSPYWTTVALCGA